MHDPISRLNAALEGRYRVERELGQGGMATVYLAVDLRHERKVALKVLHPELTAVVGHRRFLSEITTTANLHHPHILPLFDSGETGGFLYYAMPFVEGESLRARLDREGELPVDEAVRIVADLAGALDYAHRRGVIHRDLKPGNILLHDGHAVLSDFGVAIAVDAAGGNRVTQTGHSVGTPHYMSPEQAAPSGQLDGRSDIYSLACVLHEMLAGEPVFGGPTPRVVLAKHLTVPPIPVRKLRPQVPGGVEQAMLRALQKTPSDRFSTMQEFATALEGGTIGTGLPRSAWTSLRAWIGSHPFAATAAGLVVVGTVAISVTLFGAGPAWSVRPESVAVLPFRESGSTDEEMALAAELADAVTRELQRWDGVSVATDMDLAGPKEDLGLREPTLERTRDGLALAHALPAQAMVAITVRERAGSISLQARVFDSHSRRPVGEPIMTSGLLGDVDLIAPVVATLLGFGDAPKPSRALGAGTRNPAAADDYLGGRDALERNRLDGAEALFAHAVESDSTFATALSFLGQVYFWRGVEANNLISPGPDISRMSTAATRHVRGLSVESEAHVRGFYDLQLGDYRAARESYASIVQADPADAYALVMLGEIELLDRWTVRDAAGNLVPRSNLNQARRRFSAAVRLEPTFELAYGRIFAVQRELGEAALSGSCDGFQEVGDEITPVWRRSVPSARMFPLCPVSLDSLEWIAFDRFTSLDRTLLRRGADRVFRQALGELERWSTFAPDQPRPLELLSEAYLYQRQQLEVAAPERHRALAAQALRYASQAVALQPDTTAADLVRLANLHLAAGEIQRAVDDGRVALARYSESGSKEVIAAPYALANVLVASGQTSAALAIASSFRETRYLPDPESGEQIAIAGGVRAVARLEVLGASGVRGTLLGRELAQLNAAWAGEGYSPRWQQLLRDNATPQLAASLAFDSAALAEWSRSVTRDDPWWLALVLSEAAPAHAEQELVRAMDSAMDLAPSRAFVLAVAAGRLGRHTEAIRLYSRLDSIPNDVGLSLFDPDWGLQVLSHFLRAAEYEQIGDSTGAAEHYRSFIEARSWPDSLSAPLLQQARQRLTRIERD